MTRKVFLCCAAGVLAVALACSKTNNNPTSPSAATQPDAGAAADGSTLKSTTPSTVSPTGGAQVNDTVVLTASKATGKYQDVPLSYRFQVRSGTTTVYDSGVTGGVGSGNNVTHTVPAAALNPDTNYTWRVRTEYQGAFGSWSADGSFRSPVGAFIRGNEIRDPLTIGRTVGVGVGPVTFVSNGLRLGSQESRVTYQLPTTLEAGEFSLLVMGIDEGNPGDKTKVMSMQEGFGDITTNDYRVTVEKRGAQYSTPGAITFRMINGEGDDEHYIKDGCRGGSTCPFASLSDERWYFFKFVWNSTSGRLEVREDSETGRIIYNSSVTTNGHAYRPQPHVIHLGSPVGRAGPIDASIAGATYKNVYVGPGPRPIFP
jgi:hypothetical protein